MAESKGLLWNFDDYASGVLEEGTAAFFRANLVNAADRWLDEERPQEIVGWFGVREIKKGQGYMDWMEMSIEDVKHLTLSVGRGRLVSILSKYPASVF